MSSADIWHRGLLVFVFSAILGMVDMPAKAIGSDNQWATTLVTMDDSEVRRDECSWFARSLGAWRDAIGSLQNRDTVSIVVESLVLEVEERVSRCRVSTGPKAYRHPTC